MKKKALMLALIIAGSCAMTACGEKAGSATSKKPSSKPAATEAPTEEETEPEAATEAVTVSVTTEAATVPVTTVAAGNYRQDESGAVEFTAAQSELTDAEIIKAATAVYEKACELEGLFNLSSPYDIDDDSYIEAGEFGWRYYLVTTKGINKVSDVLADYHRLFTDSNDEHIRLRYVDSKGRVYCTTGARGSNIFYARTELTSVVSRSDDRICLIATSYYDGSDWNEDSYTENDNFTLVKGTDGKWRVDEFTLPY